ncbi:MAG TPA: hypothetical protein VHI31_02965 [Actinomycetota bacterium]|nr:hypothetical protein [Actinomycetota bacterium]
MTIQGRWTLGVAMALIVFAVTGCTPGSDDRAAPPPSTTTTESPPGVPLEGRVFAVAGDQSSAADLYELQFAPLRLRRLTTVNRVSAIGGCDRMLAVAAAQVEVGLVDTIQVFRDGQFRPVEGLGTPKGFAPAVNSADCRIAFTDIDRASPDLINRLRVWDPGAGTETVLEQGPDLSGVDWGPDGRLAVVVNQAASPGQPAVSTGLVLIGPDRSKKTMPAPAPDLGGLAWGSSPTMAFVRINAKATLFFNPDTGAQSELAGWFPLSWSPDGEELLVTEAGNHRELGVVKASDLGKAHRLGAAPIGVYSAVWLPAGAAPEVSRNP